MALRDQIRVSVAKGEQTFRNLQDAEKGRALKKKGTELEALLISQKAKLEELNKALQLPSSAPTVDGASTSTSSAGQN